MTTREWVERYTAQGWSCVPIPSGSKAPEEKDWTNRTFTAEDFPEGSNIGVRLGAPSGNLIDVDLDVPEAVLAARTLLPKTGCIHGRPGTGASHHWFITEIKSERWQDTDGKVLIEIRSTGGQTVLPPSIHPSGEQIAWEQERPPSKVEPAVLHHAARSVATAALLARHWPTGSRHVAARDAAGFLAARDLDPAEIEAIIRAAATAAKDDEIDDRARVARDTASTFRSGGKTTGGPTLEASVGKDVVALLLKWYGGNTSIHDNLIEEMNATRFGTRMGKDYVYGLEQEDQVVFQKAYALFEEFSNQKVKVGEARTGASKGQAIYKTKFEIWREHPKKRTYRQVVFAPPPAKAVEIDYNLWTGFAVRPLLPENWQSMSRDELHAWAQTVAKARCQLFLDLMLEVICSGNEEHFAYLVKWCAFTVQFPGIPIEIAVMMRGPQGAGKGTFARTLGKLFGRHFIHLDRSEQLTGKFNAQLSGRCLVFADEAFFAGDKRDLGALKRLITEPTLAVERKGIDIVQEANHTHLLMATNEEFAIPAGLKERRFFACSVSDHRTENHDYFSAITKQMDVEGLQALLSYLLSIQVTHDEIRRVPRTRELRKQQDMALSAEMKWLYGVLQNGSFGNDEPWPTEIYTPTIYEDYISFCDQQRHNRRIAGCNFVADVLRPYLAGERRRESRSALAQAKKEGKRVDDNLRWLWPLKPLVEARAIFDKQVGSETQWSQDDEVVEEQRAEGGQRDMPF